MIHPGEETLRWLAAVIVAAGSWLCRRLFFPSFYKREREARVEQEEAKARTLLARAVGAEAMAKGLAPDGRPERRLDGEMARAVYLARELRQRDELIAQQAEELATLRRALRLLSVRFEEMQGHLALARAELLLAEQQRGQLLKMLREETARAATAEHDLEDAQRRIVELARSASGRVPPPSL